MQKNNLSKIIADNLNKAKFQSKKLPSLPGKFNNGGMFLSERAKATQFGQYARGGEPCPEGYIYSEEDDDCIPISALQPNAETAPQAENKKFNAGFGLTNPKYNFDYNFSINPATKQDISHSASLALPNLFKVGNNQANLNLSGNYSPNREWRGNVSAGIPISHTKGREDKISLTGGMGQNLMSNVPTRNYNAGIEYLGKMFGQKGPTVKINAGYSKFKRGGGYFPEYHSYAPPRMSLGGPGPGYFQNYLNQMVQDYKNWYSVPRGTDDGFDSYYHHLRNQAPMETITGPAWKVKNTKYPNDEGNYLFGETLPKDVQAKVDKGRFTAEFIPNYTSTSRDESMDGYYSDLTKYLMSKKAYGGDISIPDLNADKWLMKYQTAGQVIPGVTDFKMPRLSNESTSLGTKIDEAAIRQAQIDKARERQGSIRKAEPKRSAASKAWAIAINPMTALSYKAKGQDIPENFDRGERNTLDNAVDIVNPFSYAQAAKDVKSGFNDGNYSQAGLGLLNFIPGKFFGKAVSKLDDVVNIKPKYITTAGAANLSTLYTPVRGTATPVFNLVYKQPSNSNIKKQLLSNFNINNVKQRVSNLKEDIGYLLNKPKTIQDIKSERILQKELGQPLSNNKGSFNEGVYRLKRFKDNLVKFENTGKVSRGMAFPEYENFDFVQAMQGLPQESIAKIQHQLRLPNQRRALFMNEVPGQSLYGVDPRIIRTIPESSISDAYNSLKKIRNQNLGFDFAGDNLNFNTNSKKINLFDINPIPYGSNQSFWIDNVLKKGDPLTYGIEGSGENLKQALKEKLSRYYQDALNTSINNAELRKTGLKPSTLASYNNKALIRFDEKLSKALDNINPYKQGGVIIKDDRGQLAHPGEITEIQGNTMATHGYGDIPLYVVPDVGEPRVVNANTGTHTFPGATKFIEYPMMQKRGGIEGYINKSLGNPMGKAERKAEQVGEKWYNPKTKKWESEQVDNFRHPMAGRYTAEAIANKFPSWMEYTGIPTMAGFIGSNALGVGHEVMNPNRNPNYTLWDRVREGGEDAFNNMIGAGVGSLPLISGKQKTKILKYLSDNNLLPDGYGKGNMYFKEKGGLIKYQTRGEVRPPIYTDDLKKVEKYKDSLDQHLSGEMYANLINDYERPHDGINAINQSDLNKVRSMLFKKFPNVYKYSENSKPTSKYEYYVNTDNNQIVGPVVTNLYKKPVQPYIYQKKPQLDDVGNVQIQNITGAHPISTNIFSNERHVEDMPISQRGQYRVGYYNPEMKDWDEAAFMSQQESDQFANEMSQRGYSGSYGNITQTKKYKSGGLTKYQSLGEVTGKNCRGKCWKPFLKDESNGSGGTGYVSNAPVTVQGLIASGREIANKKRIAQRTKELQEGFPGLSEDDVAMAMGDSARVAAKLWNFQNMDKNIAKYNQLKGTSINEAHQHLPYSDYFYKFYRSQINVNPAGIAAPLTVSEILSAHSSPQGYRQTVQSNYKQEYGGPLKKFHQGKMTGPGIFQSGGDISIPKLPNIKNVLIQLSYMGYGGTK